MKTQYGFQNQLYEQFPPVVQIALVSGLCPSNCSYCPVGKMNKGELSPNLATELPIRFFDVNIFYRIADEMAQYPWAILRIHSRGEPMEHPEYIRMIQYAKSHGVKTVTSFTNGIYLSKYIDGLLDAPINMIEISTDAADADTYLRWRRNKHFEDVFQGVNHLFAARNKRAPHPTRIVVSAVNHPEFRKHKLAFDNFWGPICDKVIIRPFHTYAGRIGDLYRNDRNTQDYIPCVQLWERFSISPTGLVNACFNDWGDYEIVGDLNEIESSIASIWGNEIFETIRSESLRSMYLDCCHKCSGPSLSSWGKAGYQHWVQELLNGAGNFSSW